MEPFIHILRSIAGLIVVIWLANVSLKFLNKYTNQDTKSMQVVERLSVHKASSLAIVKIVDDYYLMSFSEQKTETLRKFSKEEAIEIEKRLAAQKEQTQPTEALKNFDLSAVKEKFAQYFEHEK